MGCQCNFCLNDNQITQMEKHMHYLLQYRSSSYFPDKFMPQETFGIWNEKLSFPYNISNLFDFGGGTFNKTFDPLCGSYKENKITKNLRYVTVTGIGKYDSHNEGNTRIFVNKILKASLV